MCTRFSGSTGFNFSKHRRRQSILRFHNRKSRFLTFHVVCCFVIMPVMPRFMHAQTTFAWAQSRPFSVDHYSRPEMCVAFLARLRDSLELKLPLWRDTLPLSGVAASYVLPDLVIDRAKQCSVRFPSDKIVKDDRLTAIQMYLMANKDADAETLVRQKLADVPDSNVKSKFATIDTIVKYYVRATPTRLAAAHPLVIEGLRIGKNLSLISKVELIVVPYNEAFRIRDTISRKIYANLLIEAVESATEDDKREEVYRVLLAPMALRMKMEVNERELADSLRKGTSAYTAWQLANWKKLSGEESIETAIGQQAPKITGNFWLPNGSPQVRPTQGKVSLIIFLQNDTKGVERSQRLAAFAFIRRIAKQFPSVEFTLVSNTVGYFGDAALPTPEQEAKMMYQSWHDYHQLPGLLSVTNTKYWNLQKPDGRRINEPVDIMQKYSFGNPYRPLDQIFLVDQDGIIIYSSNVMREEEERLNSLIQVLLERNGGTNAR